MEIKKIDNKEKKEKKLKYKNCPMKHSNFFLTINPNQNNNTMSEEENTKHMKLINEVMDELFYKKISDFIIAEGSEQGFEYGMPKEDTREELLKRISEANAEFSIEVAPNTGKIHCHGLLCLTKRGLNTKLNLPELRIWLNQKFGKPVYLNCKTFRDSKKNLKEYINKNKKD